MRPAAAAASKSASRTSSKQSIFSIAARIFSAASSVILAAVRAVDLVAVVLSGVVAGRHADARAQPRYRTAHESAGVSSSRGVHAGGNAVRGQHAGGLAGEQRTVMAAVVGDGYLFGQAGRIEVVRQPLRCLAHGVEVHPVRARADHAAQAAGAEFQIAVKAVRDGVVVARDGDELGFDGVVQIRLGKPAVIEVVILFMEFSFIFP